MTQDQCYLDKLQDYYAQHRVFPPYAAIGRLIGLRSTASVAALVERLKQAGYLAATAERRLKPAARFFERSVVDTIQAGFASPASEALLDTLTIDDYLVENPSSTVLLTVKGDSMVEAGIQPGDLVVVERGAAARLGDIVVAIIDNEFTLKYLERDETGVYLRPANPTYGVIRPYTQLEIYGVVVGQFRKYPRR
jgi:SOS regulatory protein LexA